MLEDDLHNTVTSIKGKILCDEAEVEGVVSMPLM
jgi:hypothetical protein